jgi:glutathionylspermidine synthase
MRRLPFAPRVDWQQQLESLGFDFHTLGRDTYWVEDAAYAFDAAQIDILDDATAELHRLCLDLVDSIVAVGSYDKLGLDANAAALVEASWRRRDATLYGRMDLAYDGVSAPRLLEYNADTPTALFEASVAQWHWLQGQQSQISEPADQFNSIHEKLLETWQALRQGGMTTAHFASVQQEPEDLLTAEYLRDCAIQSGIRTTSLDISDLGWKNLSYVDLGDAPILNLFKLYPWEWLLAERFGAYLGQADTRWIEPPWKMLLSSKSILTLLWERFPRHPNLLASAAGPSGITGPLIRKPRFGREGDGVSLWQHDTTDAGPPPGRLNAWVYQAECRLPAFDGRYPVIGSWVIGDRTAGIGIREDDTPITRNSGRFVPHYFLP